jgi:excisionase family DNA binding protein
VSDPKFKGLCNKIRNQEKNPKPTSEFIDKPYLTYEEAAARLGLSPATLKDWIWQKVIPKPKRQGLYGFERKKAIFKNKYVEILRDLLIVRRSTTWTSKAELRKMCQKQLFGHR